MPWKIRSKSKKLKKHGQPEESRYWSNEFGWVTKEASDTISDEEKGMVHLPIGGLWEQSNGG